MLTIFPKVPKSQRPKALKIDILYYPNVVWRPSPWNPREYPQNVYCQKLHWATSSPLIVWVCLHWNFRYRLRKTHVLWNGVRSGLSGSSKVTDFDTNQKRVCNFLLIINSNLGPLSRFRDIAGLSCWEQTPPLFHLNLGGVPLGLDCRRWGSEAIS